MSHSFSLREAPWSAVAAATALEYRSVNHHLLIASRSHASKGGSFAAALQDACGDHGDSDIFAVPAFTAAGRSARCGGIFFGLRFRRYGSANSFHFTCP
jgi:hypothetical protein